MGKSPVQIVPGFDALLHNAAQWSVTNKRQGIDAPPGDHRGGGDRLAKGSWRAQHASIVGEQSGNCGFLIEAQTADKRHVQWLPTRRGSR